MVVVAASIKQPARRWVRKHGRNLFRTWCAASIEIPLINLTFTVFRPRVDSAGRHGGGTGSLVSQPAELPAPIYDAACSRHPTPRGGSIAANFHRFLRGPDTAHRRPSSIVSEEGGASASGTRVPATFRRHCCRGHDVQLGSDP